jgi:hypothetical protein
MRIPLVILCTLFIVACANSEPVTQTAQLPTPEVREIEMPPAVEAAPALPDEIVGTPATETVVVANDYKNIRTPDDVYEALDEAVALLE